MKKLVAISSGLINKSLHENAEMSIWWNTALNDLITLLGSLYSTSDKALFTLRRAGLDPAEIDLAGPAKVVWLRIVEEANKRGLISEFLRIGKADFPNVNFEALGHPTRTTESAGTS